MEVLTLMAMGFLILVGISAGVGVFVWIFIEAEFMGGTLISVLFCFLILLMGYVVAKKAQQ